MRTGKLRLRRSLPLSSEAAMTTLRNYTEAQKEAIGNSSPQVVVRAGAGSGKTSVLVERYLQLMTVMPAQHILAATFTNKAAAEMRARLSKRLLQSGNAQRIAELNAAPICTLHAFCSRLIAPLALELGLDPGYRILQEVEAQLLQEEAFAEVVQRWRLERADDLTLIVERLHWSADYGVRRGRALASRGFAAQFLNLVETVRSAGKGSEPPFAPLGFDARAVEAEIYEYISLLKALLSGDDVSLSGKSQEKAQHICSGLEAIFRSGDLTDPSVLAFINEISAIDARGSATYRAVVSRIRDVLLRIADVHFSPLYEALRIVLNDLHTDFLKTYGVQKRLLGGLDFLDLEEIALDLLKNRRIEQPVRQVLIDEAQDLNAVQWELLELLSRDVPFFAVGDVQQSIYGFRYADASLFSKLYQRESVFQITLEDNFRSRSAILHVVNGLFGQLWSEQDDVPFLKLQGVYPYPQGPTDAVELLVTSGVDRAQARKREAQFLAQRLIELVRGSDYCVYRETGRNEQGNPILEAQQPLWRDVFVLVRAGSSFAPLEEAFRQSGIPFVVQASRGFWDALEINDLMALLHVLEDPGDDLSLASVMCSPAICFNVDDLVELRFSESSEGGQSSSQGIARRSFYDGLCQLADGEAPAGSLHHRAAHFLNLFQRLYEIKDDLSLRQLLEIWISQTGLQEVWLRQPDRQLIINNVRKFLRLSDEMAGQPLSRLLSACEEQRIREIHVANAPSPLSGEGAVQVMTVHSAKGLEAPIVALFDLNYFPRSHDRTFAYQREKGAAFGLIPSWDEDVIPYEPTFFKELKSDQKNLIEVESQRLLYVAMTRAREKLILSTSFTHTQNDAGQIKKSGWFATLLSDFGYTIEDLLDVQKLPSGITKVFRDSEKETQILLKRSWESEISLPTAVASFQPEPLLFHTLPEGFPKSPQKGIIPISVLECLDRYGKSSFKPSIGDSAELLLDEDTAGFGIHLGNWVHRLLQLISWTTIPADLEALAMREARLILKRSPQPEELASAVQLVQNFLDSTIAAEVRQAKRVLREFPILFRASDLLLRGKLDLAFEDSNGWTLLDYKSDRRDERSIEERMPTYSLQLQFYALGWEGITGFAPRRLLLFFLDRGVSKEIHPDKTALSFLDSRP
ncbi:MAG: UvrD-helicase domain-containing protein [bacterium]